LSLKIGGEVKQVKGIAVGREYVKKGIREKMITELDIPILFRKGIG
jgi:hypothetical protein